MNDQPAGGDREADRGSEISSKPTQPQLADTLLGILRGILDNPGTVRTGETEELARDTDFGALGINSVDFLEFTIEIEEKLVIDIPDEALANEQLRSIDAWAEYLSTNFDSLRRKEDS